jgi:hypothetical protein
MMSMTKRNKRSQEEVKRKLLELLGDSDEGFVMKKAVRDR